MYTLKDAKVLGTSLDGSALILDLPAVEQGVTRWEKTADGRGGRSVPDGKIVGSVQVTINIASLRDFARRAQRNKNGRASLGHSMLVFSRCDDTKRVTP